MVTLNRTARGGFMFTKQKRVGTRTDVAAAGVSRGIYKEVIDWDAVWGAACLGFIGIVVIANIAG